VYQTYGSRTHPGYGTIVNVSSISGKVGRPSVRAAASLEALAARSGPAYTAAKGGQIAFTRWIARDVGRTGSG
jgi:3-oxoacyl-[acyl-carrier protein] reductase